MKPDRELKSDIHRRLGHAWWDDDVDRVIGEIARVLKPGGLFFYDNIKGKAG
ncbi:MAG: class I SAM-dependent methyltransferase [Polyangia bacterium]|jgi:SAM-dependent methyltransferase|nr:class I SAM-dependent methyltransferase [Polyangia bacterium]